MAPPISLELPKLPSSRPPRPQLESMVRFDQLSKYHHQEFISFFSADDGNSPFTGEQMQWYMFVLRDHLKQAPESEQKAFLSIDMPLIVSRPVCGDPSKPLNGENLALTVAAMNEFLRRHPTRGVKDLVQAVRTAHTQGLIDNGKTAEAKLAPNIPWERLVLYLLLAQSGLPYSSADEAWFSGSALYCLPKSIGPNLCTAIPAQPQDGIKLLAKNLDLSTLLNCGKLGIRWVEDWRLHLHLEENRTEYPTLLLYRYPSFCLQMAWKKRPAPGSLLLRNARVVDQPFPSLQPTTTLPVLDEEGLQDSWLMTRRLMLEIGLSYRILFAQTPASRKLVPAYVPKQSSLGSESDFYLGMICERGMQKDKDKFVRHGPPIDLAWFKPFVTAANGLNERAAKRFSAFQFADLPWDMEAEFPVLYHRWTALDALVRDYKPAGFFDITRDKRDAMQYWNFRTQLLLGIFATMSVLIGILQVIPAWITLYHQLPLGEMKPPTG